MLSTKSYPSNARGNRSGSVLLLLFMVIGCVAILSASVGFPILQWADTLTPSAKNLTIPEASYEASDVVMTLARESWYAVQLTSFDKETDALDAALSLRKRGAGGYVTENGGKHLLLASCYQTMEEAETVKQKLVATGEFADASLHHLVSEAMQLKIVATPVQSGAIKQAFALMPEIISEMSRLSLAVDKGTVDEEAARAALSLLASKATTQLETMNTALAGSNHPLTQNLTELIRTSAESIRATANNIDNTLSLSAQIKYNHMEILCRYIEYANGVATLGV